MSPDKTDAIVIGTGTRQRAELPINEINIGAVIIQTAHSVKSLGVVIDDTLSSVTTLTACAGLRHIPRGR
jgi:hypothetical protein